MRSPGSTTPSGVDTAPPPPPALEPPVPVFGKGVPGSAFISATPRAFFATSGTPAALVRCVSGETRNVNAEAEGWERATAVAPS